MQHEAQNTGQRFAKGAMACMERAEEVDRGIPRWKRALDIICILISMPLWLPLMVLLVLLIKFVSPGPVFFLQERVGYLGRTFTIFKFRTMKVNAETHTHERHFEQLMQSEVPMRKLDESGDNRLIPLGRILRATGLDELPQIFNVISGEMSLVGPRPCTVQEFGRYEDGHKERVHTAPGLTGYWQVNGKNRTTFSEMIAMDVFYIKNRSIQLDVKIILKTVPALMGQNAKAETTAELNQ